MAGSVTETDERPTKLRKLDNGTSSPQSALDDEVSITSDLTSSQPLPKTSITELHTPVSEISTPTEPQKSVNTLSKNQLKRQRRKAEWEAGREGRKLKRRQKEKERKARKREQLEQEQKEADGADAVTPVPNNPSIPVPRTRLPIAFIIDCGFDDLMIDKERVSLGSQLTRCYSDNSRARWQGYLYVSSWNGQLKERFDTVIRGTYKNWRGIKFTDQNFADSAKIAHEAMRRHKGERFEGALKRYAPSASVGDDEISHIASNVQQDDQQSQSRTTRVEPETVNLDTVDAGATLPSHHLHSNAPSLEPLPGETIYLTSDSPYTLTSLHPYTTYIIGGLVDKNRHKGICYKRACEADGLVVQQTAGANTGSSSHHGEVPSGRIKTAKLPIGQYMEMTSRFVLATNHVLEIMLKWLETGDWGEAFLRVVPKRKGGKLKGRSDGPPQVGDEASADRRLEDDFSDGGSSDTGRVAGSTSESEDLAESTEARAPGHV